MTHADDDFSQRAEALQRRIARLRRRIDRQASRVVDRSMQLVSWRSYIARRPAESLLAAVGAGLTLSAVLSRVRLPQDFGTRLYDLALSGSWAQLWEYLRTAPIHLEPAAEAPGGVPEETAEPPAAETPNA